MIRSMTGFSESLFEGEGFRLSLSLRSINHRYLDLKIRLPRTLTKLESTVRKILKEGCARGHIEARVYLEQNQEPKLRINQSLIDAYLEILVDLKRKYKFTQEPDLMRLIQSPGVIESGNNGIESPEFEGIAVALEKITYQALSDLNSMRDTEGANLEKDMRIRLNRIQEFKQEVESLGTEMPTRIQRKIEIKIKKMLPQTELDQQRLLQEAALLASHSDISEELARLTSHIGQAFTVLDLQGETGKKLDFLFQEMNREANTILSKIGGSDDVGLEITRISVEIKSEIEKVREQVQNIE